MTPTISRRHLLLATGAAALPAFSVAQAAWPSKPIRIVTPFTVGGASDVIARSLAVHLSAALKQPVNIDPRPGADGALAAQELLRQPADGHTLFFATASALSYVPNMRKNPGYDVARDFTPLTSFVTFTFYLMVHESIPGQNLSAVMAHVKANPGKYSYASGNSTALLAAALMTTSVGADMTHAPYKGESQAVIDLVGGRVQMMWASPTVMPALMKDGKFRPLAVLLPERSSAMPDVPTIGEAGQPLVNVVPWGGFVAQAALPRDIATLVAQALRDAMSQPEMRPVAASAGLVLRPSSSEAMARLLVEQLAAYGQAIKQAKLTQEP